MQVSLLAQLPEPLQDQFPALEDPLLAFREAGGEREGDRDGERAVRGALATRRFGDATLARGWSGGSEEEVK